MPNLKTSLKIERPESEKLIIRGIWGPSRREWRDVIEDYVYLSRKRFDNKLSMVKLQMEIFHDIYESEGYVRAYKDILKHPENIKQYNADIEQLFEVDKESIERELDQTTLLIKALKEVVDGHVWRIFNFNRPLLFNLGKEPSPGNLEIDGGFLAELQGWGKSILDSNVSHFVLNGITNFARIGDTIERNFDGLIEVKEIKLNESQRSKERQGRLERQQIKMKNFESLANLGEVIIDGNRTAIFDSAIPYRNSLKTVEDGLKESERNGIFARKINTCLTIIGIDQEVSEKNLSKDYIREFTDVSLKSSFKKNDVPVRLNSMDRIKHTPNLTPLTLYPFSDKMIADLLLGEKLLCYYFSPIEFFRILEKNNWKVTSSFFDQSFTDSIGIDNIYCRIKQGDLNIGIPWSLIFQIIFDTLDLSKAIDLFNLIYKNNISESIRYFIKFKDEEKIWK